MDHFSFLCCVLVLFVFDLSFEFAPSFSISIRIRFILCVFTLLVPCSVVRTISAWNDVRFVLTPSCFVGELMFYLCLFAHSCVKYSSLYEWHGGCLIRGRNCLSFASTCVHLRFLVWSVLLIFWVFCVALWFCVLFVFVVCLVCKMLCLWIFHSWLALRFL